MPKPPSLGLCFYAGSKEQVLQDPKPRRESMSWQGVQANHYGSAESLPKQTTPGPEARHYQERRKDKESGKNSFLWNWRPTGQFHPDRQKPPGVCLRVDGGQVILFLFPIF